MNMLFGVDVVRSSQKAREPSVICRWTMNSISGSIGLAVEVSARRRSWWF